MKFAEQLSGQIARPRQSAKVLRNKLLALEKLIYKKQKSQTPKIKNQTPNIAPQLSPEAKKADAVEISLDLQLITFPAILLLGYLDFIGPHLRIHKYYQAPCHSR